MITKPADRQNKSQSYYSKQSDTLAREEATLELAMCRFPHGIVPLMPA